MKDKHIYTRTEKIVAWSCFIFITLISAGIFAPIYWDKVMDDIYPDWHVLG